MADVHHGETFYYHESPDNLVSNLRVVLDGVTYAVGNLTSVRSVRYKARRYYYIFPAVGGVLLAVSGLVLGAYILALIGVFVVGSTVATAFTRRWVYAVVLGTCAGEVQAQHSYKPYVVAKIVEAIALAIADRQRG